eukprot:204543-Pyramimonas_sp.AAC.1
MSQAELLAFSELSLALRTSQVAARSTSCEYGVQELLLGGVFLKAFRGSKRSSSSPSSATGVGLATGLVSLAVSDSLLASSSQSGASVSPSVLPV